MVVERKQKLFWNQWTKWNILKPCRSWRNQIFSIRITLFWYRLDFNNLFWYRVLIIWSRVFIIWHRVGKTAIISQFLYDQFCSEYKPTVITLSYYACDNVEKKYVGATFMCEAISSSHKYVFVDDVSFESGKSMICLLKVKSFYWWKWFRGFDRLPPVKTNSHRITETVKNSLEGRLKRLRNWLTHRKQKLSKRLKEFQN